MARPSVSPPVTHPAIRALTIAGRVARVARAAGVAGVTGTAALAAVRRRWEMAPDETDGRPMELPDGQEVWVNTPDGAALAALTCGAAGAQPIVLAHGWTADRRVWSATARFLVEAGHRVVVYDQRGHGRSTLGSAPLDIDTLAGDVRAVLEQLDLHDVVLAGHSMGGMAVQRFAALHKDVLAERVAAVVLVSTAASEVGRGGPQGQIERRFVGGVLANRVVSQPLIGPFAMRSTVGRRPVLAHLKATAETFVATPAPVRRALLESMSAMDLTEGLGGIAVPTIVVSGERDNLTLHQRSQAIAALIPGARLISLPGAGHQLVFEAPRRLAEVLGGCAQRPPVAQISAE